MKNFLDIKFVPKGWGYEKWIVNTKEYCGKILWFHKIKDEVFYIRTGRLEVTYGYDEDIKQADKVILEPGDNFYVATGLIHQMKALEDTEMFEFSTQHFDEDSYRVEKGD